MLTLAHVTLALVVAARASVIRECTEVEEASYSAVKISSSSSSSSSSGEKCLNCSNINSASNFTIGSDSSPDQMTDVGAEAEAASSGQGQTEPQGAHPPRESVAVKPDPGISRRVSLGPSKKKDLGALGYALGALLMAVIIVMGTGITIGYVYRKGVKLRLQQEQRAYEQEMHRINLPLSAFTNPACDLIDEQPATASVLQAGEKEKENPSDGEDRIENVG